MNTPRRPCLPLNRDFPSFDHSMKEVIICARGVLEWSRVSYSGGVRRMGWLVLGLALMLGWVRGAGAGDVPVAAVVPVGRADLAKVLTIPAEFRPYEEVSVHAKVSGYVAQMLVDIGDRVKAGQLLATLEVPELDAEWHRAQAEWQKAVADHTNADLIYSRLTAVNGAHANLVAQQELDTAAANEQRTAAAITAAQAEVDKYQSLENYTRITAPFDGVVTHRYADPGSLIQAGTASDSQAMPLVRVSDNYRLRLDFPVTVDYVKDIQLGDSVVVRVDSLNGRTFTGTITRFTRQVEVNTRTMLTEIEVTNADLTLVPGMYATAELKVERRTKALAIPVEAVSDESAPTVLVVNANQQVEERPVRLGLHTTNQYEVLSGLKEGELVVVGRRTQFQLGEQVQPQMAQLGQGGGQ